MGSYFLLNLIFRPRGGTYKIVGWVDKALKYGQVHVCARVCCSASYFGGVLVSCQHAGPHPQPGVKPGTVYLTVAAWQGMLLVECLCAVSDSMAQEVWTCGMTRPLAHFLCGKRAALKLFFMPVTCPYSHGKDISMFCTTQSTSVSFFKPQHQR